MYNNYNANIYHYNNKHHACVHTCVISLVICQSGLTFLLLTFLAHCLHLALLQALTVPACLSTLCYTSLGISQVKLWMHYKKLKLNDENTESLLIKSDRIMLPDSAPTSIQVGNSDNPFVTHVRNLGITISSNTTIDKHVTNICRST